MQIRSSLLASLSLALGLANPALAETHAAETSSAASGNDQSNFVALTEDPDLLKRLQDEEIALLQIRAAYPAYFAEAYARHPQIPQGVLEERLPIRKPAGCRRRPMPVGTSIITCRAHTA